VSRSVALDGFVHPDFIPVATALRAQLEQTVGGAAACVWHRGECVVDVWGGVRDAEGRPWERDTMSPSFSTTKGVATTVLHVLVDRGLFDYDDPVCRHWPEFAQAGKAGITVRHVLSHQSGLHHIRRMVDRAERMLDWEYMIRAIEQAEPDYPPGTRTGYHGLTYGYLVGEIVQRVTGRRFSDLVREILCEPLRLDGCYIGTPVDQLHRAARLLWPARLLFVPGELTVLRWSRRELAEVMEWPAWVLQRALGVAGIQLDLASIFDALAPRGIGAFDFGAEETLRVAIPAANGLFTARSLAKIYATLAAGGALDGVRLLSPATLARATERQSPVPGRLVIPFDMRWRLGWHGVLTTRGVPRHAFGHFGFGGSGAWADPSRELAVALIVNCGLGTPFGDMRILRIGGAALACANERRQRRQLVAGGMLPGRRPALPATSADRGVAA
jgi:CubicO group peptidase (beta-lactamase class C family)